MLQVQHTNEAEQMTNSPEVQAFSKVTGQDLTASTSGVVASVIGTITSGSIGLATEGASLKPYSSILAAAKDKAGSVSSLTFTLEQEVWINNALQVFEIGKLTVTPGNTAYASFPLPQPKTASTFRAIVSAASAYPQGADNFTLNVSGF